MYYNAYHKENPFVRECFDWIDFAAKEAKEKEIKRQKAIAEAKAKGEVWF